MLLRRGRQRRRRDGRAREEILACMSCGSRKIQRKRLFDGPVVYEHDTAETRVCLDCGASGIPLIFSSEEERKRFASEKEDEAKETKSK